MSMLHRIGGLVIVMVLAGCASSTVAPSTGAPTVQQVAETPTATPSSSSTAAPAFTPTSAPSATVAPTPIPQGTATRLVIDTLKIDLPVIPAVSGKMTPCGVAVVIPKWDTPNLPQVVYIAGMGSVGGPLRRLSVAVKDGRDITGMQIQVYTSANVVFTYTVAEVRRHVDPTKVGGWTSVTTPQLWVQTADDPRTDQSPAKPMHVIASQVGAAAADPTTSHPKAKPTTCP